MVVNFEAMRRTRGSAEVPEQEDIGTKKKRTQGSYDPNRVAKSSVFPTSKHDGGENSEAQLTGKCNRGG
jgi:hypothetical protein